MMPLHWIAFGGRRHLFDRASTPRPVCDAAGDFGVDDDLPTCPRCLQVLFEMLDRAWV